MKTQFIVNHASALNGVTTIKLTQVADSADQDFKATAPITITAQATDLEAGDIVTLNITKGNTVASVAGAVLAQVPDEVKTAIVTDVISGIEGLFKKHLPIKAAPSKAAKK